MVKITQESSQSLKHIRPISARKLTTPKQATRKKVPKPDPKLLRRLSPKIITPNTLDSNSKTFGRNFSSESNEMNKTLSKLESEHSDLLSLYTKMSEELLHLKKLEKLGKQKEKQIMGLRQKVVNNFREKGEIEGNIKVCEGVLKEFVKKMEKGSLSVEEKKGICRQVQEFYAGISGVSSENSLKGSQIEDLWSLIPKAEKVFKSLKVNKNEG